VGAIREGLLEVKHLVRRDFHKFYSQDLINSLFAHPYARIQFLEEELGVSRLTARKYLDALAGAGILQKMKVGRSSYYLNVRLCRILAELPVGDLAPTGT
jgi:Fic family protein